MKIAILTQEKYTEYAESLLNLNTEIFYDHKSYMFSWYAYDLVISLLYDRIVKNNEFDIPKYGTINIHPSFLPHHRGSAPNFWAVMSGVGAGWTAHRMTAEIDRGDIYLQQPIHVLLSDTAETLWERLFEELPSFLSNLATVITQGELKPIDVTQDIERVNKLSDFHAMHDYDNLLQAMNEQERVASYAILNLIQACSFTGYEGFIMNTPDGRVEFTARKLDD